MMGMVPRVTLWSVAFALWAASGRYNVAFSQARAADTIYFNGKVVTVDRRFSIASAFAVTGDRIVAVGTNAVVHKLAGPTTHMVDLKGHSVFPGFVDSHPHTINGHAREDELYKVSLHGVHSVDEIVHRIRNAVSTAAPGSWIVTTDIGDPPDYFGLPDSLAEKRWPTRKDLDRASTTNPIYISGGSIQSYPSLFNSAALALLGVTRDTTGDDVRVRIEKDQTGEPTGVIDGLDMYSHNSHLRSKLLSLLPLVPDNIRKEVIRESILDEESVGVTSLYEAHGLQLNSVETLRAMKSSGNLGARFVLAPEVPASKSLGEIDQWMSERTDAVGAGSGDDVLTTHGATVSMDGATQFGATLMSKPYLDASGRLRNGESSVTAGKLTEIARLAAKHNLRLNIQAAGDQAIDMAIQALEAVNKEMPLRERHWVVEHVQLPSQEDIRKLKSLGVLATTYSSVDFSKGAEIYVKRFPGQDVWKTVIPLRWWLDGGVTVAQGTDGAHYDPMFTIWESLVRLDGRTGQSLLTPAKTISRKEAIQIYTINGARVMQWEDRIGSIETGKYADFVILDHDILTCPVDQIRDTKVLLTSLGGEIIHGSPPRH